MEQTRSRSGSDPPWRSPATLPVFAAILVVELALLLVGFGVWTPFRAAALALGLVYFLIAFRSPDVAWAIAFLCLPLSSELRTPFGEVSVPSEPMILVGLFAWALRSLRDGTLRLPSSRLNLPLTLLATVSLASVLFGAYRLAGFKAWTLMAAYVAFGYLYFAGGSCDRARRARWVGIAATSGALFGLYGTVRVLALGVDPRSAYGAARPFFAEHGTYAAYLCLIFPVAVFEAFSERGRWRAYLAAASFLMFLGIVFSFTRAAWLSLALVLPPALILWARRRGAWRRVAIAGLGAVFLSAVLIVSVNEGAKLARHAESVVATENVSNLERLNRWIAAWEMIQGHPWMGIGYGGYVDAYSSYRRKAVVTEQTLVRMGVHSEPLRLLSETGVFGLLAAMWFLGLLGWEGWRRFRFGPEAGSALTLGLLAGIATYAVHGIFNSYLGLDRITMPFWMEIGALAALAAPPRRDP